MVLTASGMGARILPMFYPAGLLVGRRAVALVSRPSPQDSGLNADHKQARGIAPNGVPPLAKNPQNG
jgi:hypothetical protein